MKRKRKRSSNNATASQKGPVTKASLERLIFDLDGFLYAALLTHNKSRQPKMPEHGFLSLNIVSLFNLQISLELFLKGLLIVGGYARPSYHFLTKLYDKLPQNVSEQLEELYSDAIRAQGEVILLRYAPSPAPTKSDPSENKPLNNLRDILEYFDREMEAWQKRYTWEYIEKDKWIYSLGEIRSLVYFCKNTQGMIIDIGKQKGISDDKFGPFTNLILPPLSCNSPAF